MTQQHECQGCHHQNSCADVYRLLGHADTAPVTLKVCVAFVFPLIAFVLSLAVFEAILDKSVGTKGATLIGFVVALMGAMGAAALGSWIMRTWPKTTRNGL